MKGTEMIQWLKRLEKNTLGIVCSGCGHERNCASEGCAAAKALKAFVKVQIDSVNICDSCKYLEGDFTMSCLDTDHGLECSECKDKCVCGKCENGENFELDEGMI